MSVHWDGDLASAEIDPSVWALRRDYAAVLIVASHLSPGPPSAQSEALLREAETQSSERLRNCEPHELAPIAEWRSAYASFGVKPRDGRSSVEALMRRASAGLPRIDRLTDTYNAISVIHQVPIGGEDRSGYVGPPRLVVAQGEETFDTVVNGDPVVDHASVGEVIWRDDLGVTCRRWNWRQCVRTRLTTDTTDALFIIDSLGPDSAVRAQDVARDLMSRLKVDSPAVQFSSRLMTA